MEPRKAAPSEVSLPPCLACLSLRLSPPGAEPASLFMHWCRHFFAHQIHQKCWGSLMGLT